MKNRCSRPDRFGPGALLLCVGAAALALLLCVCLGSVTVPPGEVLSLLLGRPAEDGLSRAIVLEVRLPRVLCAALCGAALSLCGAAMQGLLRNPLADGATLGVSSGAALGAALSIAFGWALPGLRGAGTMGMASAFAFASLLCVLAVAGALDASLSTETVVLTGVVFSMFASALVNLVVTFAGSKARTVLFWTMGSVASCAWGDCGLLAGALALCGTPLLLSARELNAFAAGEENARSVGVSVRRVKLLVLALVSALTGVCVAICGAIGFVGLVIPHMARRLFGPNHRRLLPASLFLGAVFLPLCDLAARTIASPRELPIGVVTSLIGAAAFVPVFRAARSAR